MIEPRLQLRFSLIFLTSAALAALVQSITFSFLLMKIADRLPNDGLELKSRLTDVLAGSFLVTLAILVPLTMAVGIAATHRVVGPLYRFRVYLTELAGGQRPGPCKIREKDESHPNRPRSSPRRAESPRWSPIRTMASTPTRAAAG